jgi:hypothetical protein
LGLTAPAGRGEAQAAAGLFGIKYFGQGTTLSQPYRVSETPGKDSFPREELKTREGHFPDKNTVCAWAPDGAATSVAHLTCISGSHVTVSRGYGIGRVRRFDGQPPKKPFERKTRTSLHVASKEKPVQQVQSDRWVLINVLVRETGYTDDAIRAKIRRGDWAKRAFWRKAPDGRLAFNLTRIQAWMCSV